MLREFRSVLPYLPRYRGAVLLGMAFIPFSRALDLLIPWVIGKGVDELGVGELGWSLQTYFLIIAGLALLKGVGKFAMRFLVVGASRRFEEEFRNDLFRHLLSMPPRFFQEMRTGDLMARVSWDVEGVRMLLGPGVMYLTETLFMLPAVVILASYDWLLAVLLLFPLALIAWTMHRYAGPIHDESMRAQERLASMSNAAQENFAGVRVVRSFAAESRQEEQFADSSREYCEQNIQLARVRGRSWALIVCARDLGFLVLLSVGCYKLMTGAITVGQFWVFVAYLGLLFWPMIALGWMVGMVQRGRASMRRLNDILHRQPAIPAVEDPYAPEQVRGEVEFRDLRFRYGDQPVLDGISLGLAPGDVLGITGTTGSGKSTLAQVLPRLIDVEPGQAFLDGVDVTRWDPTCLRRAIGLVPQEAFLFADTLRANLALGREDEDEQAILAGLRAAHVEQELLALPDGLDAVVGERGVTLSGGQRQRVTIARALASDPSLLIFDDCLSAVDAETEERILRDLTAALAGRTCILISHRVSALQMADQVCVLEHGKIVERGAPAELLSRGGRYLELYRRQQAEDELDRL